MEQVTGDDFKEVNCDPSLSVGDETLGCVCNSAPHMQRSKCHVGLHTALMGQGRMQFQYARVEKCGQRGIQGKYCLHLHQMGTSGINAILRGNAIEFGQQRGIVIHGSHLSTVEHNVCKSRAKRAKPPEELETHVNHVCKIFVAFPSSHAQQ